MSPSDAMSRSNSRNRLQIPDAQVGPGLQRRVEGRLRVVIPVILSGGSGTRLWPISRKDLPKQFHALAGRHTMLQQTALRAASLDMQAPVVVCNAEQKHLVTAQLSSIGITPGAILVEPEPRNTGPAAVAAALYARTL